MEKRNGKSKYGFWAIMIDPWSVLKKQKLAFFLWTSFTLIAGQIGTFINIIRRVIFGNFTFKQSLLLDSESGSFYVFSIALIASSVLSPLFIKILESEKFYFRGIKVSIIVFSIFILFFEGVFYSLSLDVDSLSSKVTGDNIVIDWGQLVFFLISILFSLYTYCVLKLDDDPQRFEHLNDKPYHEREKEGIQSLENEISETKKDSNGNKL